MNMIEAYEDLHGVRWDATVPSIRACWADAWNLAVENECDRLAAENKELREALELADPVLRSHYRNDCRDDDLLTATCDAMIAVDKTLAKYKEPKDA